MIAKRFIAAMTVCLAIHGNTLDSQAGEKATRSDTARTASTPAAGNDPDLSKTNRFAPALDRRFIRFDPQADLEGRAVFAADQHKWGYWHSYRVEVEIRNVDTNYSTSLRTYEVGTAFQATGGVLAQGFIPSLSPGESYSFDVPVTSDVFLGGGLFYLHLSKDKNNSNNQDAGIWRL